MTIRLARLTAAAAVGLGVFFSVFSPTAGADDVKVSPSCGADCPGGEIAQKVLNWAGQYGLWASVLGVILGGGMFAYSYFNGGAHGASRGQQMILAACVGVIAIGAAPSVINLLYSAAG